MKVYFCAFVGVHLLFSCGSSSSNDDSNLNDTRSSALNQVAKPRIPADGSLDENSRYPIKPNLEMTPGDLCASASELRYPEKIKYCNRNVDKSTKAMIFDDYDQKLGFETQKMERGDFKIDHLIPLCMGGSNKEDNLWPQHKSVYAYTDPVEPYLCDLMSIGKLKQKVAVEIILSIKLDPVHAAEKIRDL
ncbi:MAG: hypothetical protein NT027_18605 [Proteobacteria bacterium]|nr:hypothetical protein [Pseudomonadota bacterium]